MTPSTDPARLFLVRHGQVTSEWRGRLYGGHDVPLSAMGEAQARAAAHLLAAESLAAVVSSGLSRAELGARLIREGRGLERRDEAALRELDRGDWLGLSYGEVPDGLWDAWLAAPGSRRPPGGESLSDLSARVLPCLDALAAEHSGAGVAIVAHSWVIRVAICEALALSLDAAPRLAMPFGGLTILDWTPSPRRVVLAGLGTDRAPVRGAGWYRGPRRG